MTSDTKYDLSDPVAVHRAHRAGYAPTPGSPYVTVDRTALEVVTQLALETEGRDDAEVAALETLFRAMGVQDPFGAARDGRSYLGEMSDEELVVFDDVLEIPGIGEDQAFEVIRLLRQHSQREGQG